jgi:hypothetical protein
VCTASCPRRSIVGSPKATSGGVTEEFINLNEVDGHQIQSGRTWKQLARSLRSLSRVDSGPPAVLAVPRALCRLRDLNAALTRLKQSRPDLTLRLELQAHI